MEIVCFHLTNGDSNYSCVYVYSCGLQYAYTCRYKPRNHDCNGCRPMENRILSIINHDVREVDIAHVYVVWRLWMCFEYICLDTLV